MTWLLIGIVALAVWHYVWDGILSPSLRAQYRFELFAIRDRARELKYTGGLDADRFQGIDDSINTAVRFAPSLTIAALLDSRRAIDSDPELQKHIEQRVAYLGESRETKALFDDVVRVMYRALVANSGGWFIFLVPVLAVVISGHAAYNLVERLVALTENEVLRAMPALGMTDMHPA